MPYFLEPAIEGELAPEIECLGDAKVFRRRCRELGLAGLERGIVPPEIVPREFVIKQRKKPTNGIFRVRVGIAVDQRVVDVIEDIEPGVHQFIPMDVKMEDGSDLDLPHYLLNCGAVVDALDPDRSEVRIRGGTKLGESTRNLEPAERFSAITYRYSPRGASARLTLYADLVDGRALWRDTRLDEFLIGDAVHDRLAALGVGRLTTRPRLFVG